MSKFYLTTPIYYVNAKPHIGHVYTTIAADVLARYYRKKFGEDNVLFSTGTDENSQKNVEAAEKEGKDVKAYVDEMAGLWEQTFQKLGFTYNTFIRTTAPEHEQAVKKLLSAIEAKGDIYLGDYEGFYCVSCEEFKAPNEIVDGKCPIHHTEPKRIKEKNYFFKLAAYRETLLEYYENHPDFVQPESAHNKMLDYIKNDLADISISRQAQKWGIRLPQDETHAVYVWFDALINYLTVAGYAEGGAKFQKFWPADLHLIGKDIIKFHCAIWPAMLLSAGLPLPKKVFAHGFFTVDGDKISKSLGNAIDPLELMQEYPFDAIRYYVLRDIPFGNDGDFSHDRLKQRYNADLANGLGNLVSRVLNMMEKFAPDFAPNSTPGVELASSPGVGERLAVGAVVSIHLESLAFDRALESIWQKITQADELIERTKPWELVKKSSPSGEGELEGVLTQLYQTLLTINQSLAPFLPDTHAKLTKILAARPLKKPAEPLFARK